MISGISGETNKVPSSDMNKREYPDVESRFSFISDNNERIQKLLSQKAKREKTRAILQNNKKVIDNMFLAVETFESYVNYWMDIIRKILIEKLWIHINFPEVIFTEENIIEYRPDNNTIAINPSSFLKTYQNNSVCVLWALAHEVCHSIQVQQELFNFRNVIWKTSAESHADVFSWYVLQEMVQIGQLDEQDIHDYWFTLMNDWDDCEFISLVEGSVNLHWDGEVRSINLYSGYTTTADEIKKTLVKSEITNLEQLTSYFRKKNGKRVQDILSSF